MTIILQIQDKKETTRKEFDDWLDAMNEGSLLKFKDNELIISIFAKGGSFDQESQKNFLKMDKALLDADTVARLEEEIAKAKNELRKNAFNISDNQRRNLSLKIIDYQKILYGDKPHD